MCWEAKFPLAFVRSLARPTSDNVPLYLDFEDRRRRAKKRFHFKKMWLQEDSVRQVVE